MGCSPTKASRAPAKPASNHHPVAHLLQAHDLRSAIHCVAISEDRSLLVAGDEKGCVSMWSTRSTPTECLGELFGHQVMRRVSSLDKARKAILILGQL